VTVPLPFLAGGAALLAAFVLMVLVQASVIRRVEQRVGFLERWGQEKDPESFGIYHPDLDPDPPTPDCEAAGGFHVLSEGSTTCQNCPAVLV
jgi:hypothetical protein